MRNRPLYAFDAEEDAVRRWNTVSSQVAEELRVGKISPLFSGSDFAATEVLTAAH